METHLNPVGVGERETAKQQPYQHRRRLRSRLRQRAEIHAPKRRVGPPRSDHPGKNIPENGALAALGVSHDEQESRRPPVHEVEPPLGLPRDVAGVDDESRIRSVKLVDGYAVYDLGREHRGFQGFHILGSFAGQE